MQQAIRGLPPAVAERWSRRRFELQPKEVDLTDLDKWLEAEVQVKEMAFDCARATEHPKQDSGKSKPNASRSKWFKKQKDVPFTTRLQHQEQKQSVLSAKESME